MTRIGAEEIAGRFGSYWTGVAPRLEHFVRASNRTPDRINPPLEIAFEPSRQALVSEAGFVFWSAARRGGTDAAFQPSVREAAARLLRLGVRGVDSRLSAEEAAAAKDIAGRLDGYFAGVLPLTDVEVEPALPACGVVAGGTPDVIGVFTKNELAVEMICEVKAVSRSVRSRDLRQMMVYAALYWADRARVPGAFSLFNPVMGTAVTIDVNEFFEAVSGAAADDVLHRLVLDWSEPRASF